MKATRTLDDTTFWTHVDQDESGCWLWTAATSRGGYGQFNVAAATTRQAHRLSFEHIVGPIPDGLVLDHLCRVRNCVNPEHLEVVTIAENSRRASAVRVKVTHCPEGHFFSEANTRTDSEGRRHCKECHRTRFNPRVEVKCEACHRVMSSKTVRSHERVCPGSPPDSSLPEPERTEVGCEGCGRVMSSKSLKRHLGRCPATRDNERAEP